MTPEQKARLITNLIQARQSAAEQIEAHELEALRYRLQYKNLGDEITKLFQTPMIGEEIQGRSFSCVIVDDAVNWDLESKKMAAKIAFGNRLQEIKKRLLTKKKRTGKLNR